jgi:hypothetical protein
MDRYEEAKTFCDHAICIKSIIQNVHPPHLDNEKVADVDALACVSRGHCDGLGDEGDLLNMQLYLL